MTKRQPTIAVIGAGFSGSLLALHLLRLGPPDLRVSLIERGGAFARGLAYSAHNPRHMLNVRVGNMSAWPDDPDHLVRWLTGSCGRAVGLADFISRGDFGRYLAAMLQAAVVDPGGADRLRLEHDEAVDLSRTADGLRLTMAMGRSFEVDRAILATGNPPPAALEIPGFDALDRTHYAADPWSGDAIADLAPDAPVLLLGSGLTMVDVAVALDTSDHTGPIHVLSRRGLTPRRHGGAPMATADGAPNLDMALSQQLRLLRRRARQTDWREAVDALRPLTPAIWRRSDLATRRRFLRHLRPWWDVHRHRLAPAVADWFADQQARGRIRVSGGRIAEVTANGDGVAVAWRPRGQTALHRLDVARIINCTGPGADLTTTREPLLRGLLDRGLARPAALGIGLDVQADGAVIDADGRADGRLHAVGPVTRGVFWEVIAVPDIRNQVADLAARLAGTLARPLQPAEVPLATPRTRP